MKVRKLVAGAAVAAGITLAATPALAHECFVAKRSDRGNAAVASNSQAWAPLTPDFIFSEFFGLSGEQLTCAVNEWYAQGLPGSVVIGIKQAILQDGVIMGLNPNAAKLAADGRGIDWAEAVYGESAFLIAQGCSGD